MKNLGSIGTFIVALGISGCSEAPKSSSVEHDRQKAIATERAKTTAEARGALESPKGSHDYDRLLSLAQEACDQGETRQAIRLYTGAIRMIDERFTALATIEHPTAEEQEEIQRLRRLYGLANSERSAKLQTLSEKEKSEMMKEIVDALLDEQNQLVRQLLVKDAKEDLDQPIVGDGFPGRLHALVNAREASQKGDSVRAIGRYTHAIVMILEDMATIEKKEHPSVKEQEELERLRKQFDIVVAERKQQFEKLSAEQKGAAVREADSESRVTNLREPWSDPLVLEYEQQHGNRVRKSRRPFEESLPHPFEKAIESLREQGEIKGYPDGEFRPEPQVNPVK